MARKKENDIEQQAMTKSEEDTVRQQAKHGTVIGGALNIRTEPSLNAKIVRVLNDGEEIEILEEQDGWIRIGDGFVSAKWIQTE